MKIELYNSTAELNRVDKTSYLTSIGSYTGEFKTSPSKPVDYQRPTLLIQDKNLTNTLKANYLAIDTRYYFIKQRNIVTNDLIEFICELDVLMTFKEDIYKQSCFIDRQETIYSELIKDTMVPYEYEKEVTYSLDGTSGDVFINVDDYPDPSHLYNILVSTYNFEQAYLNYLGSSVMTVVEKPLKKVNTLFDGGNLNAYHYVINLDYLRAIIINIRGSEYWDQIMSIKLLPFEPTRDDTKTTDLKIGDKQVINANIPILKSFNEIKHVYHLQIPLTKTYLDFSPYTQYELWVPYFGWVNIPIELCIDTSPKGFYTEFSESEYIYLYLACDYSTDSYTYYLLCRDQIIWFNQVDIGVNLGLSKDNAYQVKNNSLLNGVQTSFGVITSLLGSGILLAGGLNMIPASLPTFMMGTTMALNGAYTATKSVANEMGNFTNYNTQMSSGPNSLNSSTECYLRITKSVPVKNVNNKKFIGKPCQQNYKLEDLKGKGYTQVGMCNIENIGSATKDEIVEITNQLQNGVIL